MILFGKFSQLQKCNSCVRRSQSDGSLSIRSLNKSCGNVLFDDKPNLVQTSITRLPNIYSSQWIVASQWTSDLC